MRLLILYAKYALYVRFCRMRYRILQLRSLLHIIMHFVHATLNEECAFVSLLLFFIILSVIFYGNSYHYIGIDIDHSVYETRINARLSAGNKCSNYNDWLKKTEK